MCLYVDIVHSLTAQAWRCVGVCLQGFVDPCQISGSANHTAEYNRCVSPVVMICACIERTAKSRRGRDGPQIVGELKNIEQKVGTLMQASKFLLY